VRRDDQLPRIPTEARRNARALVAFWPRLGLRRPAVSLLALGLLLAGPRAPAEAAAKAFLWNIASPTATVHLLGSIHVASRDTYPLDPRIESAFEQSRVLVIEAPIDQAAQLEAGLKMAHAGTYPEADTIDMHLDRETLELLQRHLQRSGTPFEAVRRFRPWLVATVLILNELQKAGYQPALGIDRYFAEKAREQKPIRMLETVDEQVAVFAGMAERVQENVLKETLATLDETSTMMAQAFASWQTGDATTLDALLVAPVRTGYPDVFQRLFVDRNRRMAATLETLLRSGGEYFVVIGAGHLVGPGGILDLLRSRGYQSVQQ